MGDPVNTMTRLLFLGQKHIGQNCFQWLVANQSEHLQVVGAVSNIDTNNWWRDNAIYRATQESGLPFLDNSRRNSGGLAKMISDLEVNCLVSVNHGWIITDELLKSVNGMAFNMHLAKLPKYKGWNAFSHAILNQDPEFSVSVHWMVAALDSGDMAYEASLPILPDDTAISLYTRAERAGFEQFKLLVVDLAGGRTPPRRPLVGEGRVYGRRALDALREVTDFSDPVEVERRTRALFFPPYEPVFYRSEGRKIYLVPEGSWAGLNQAKP